MYLLSIKSTYAHLHYAGIGGKIYEICDLITKVDNYITYLKNNNINTYINKINGG